MEVRLSAQLADNIARWSAGLKFQFKTAEQNLRMHGYNVYYRYISLLQRNTTLALLAIRWKNRVRYAQKLVCGILKHMSVYEPVRLTKENRLANECANPQLNST